MKRCAELNAYRCSRSLKNQIIRCPSALEDCHWALILYYKTELLCPALALYNSATLRVMGWSKRHLTHEGGTACLLHSHAFGDSCVRRKWFYAYVLFPSLVWNQDLIVLWYADRGFRTNVSKMICTWSVDIINRHNCATLQLLIGSVRRTSLIWDLVCVHVLEFWR